VTKYLNSVKEERFIWAHGFRSFHPWSLDFVVSGLLVRQSIMAEKAMVDQYCLPHAGQEAGNG
jgi:hypothetical protein